MRSIPGSAFRYRRISARAWTYAAGFGGLLACERLSAATIVRIVSGRFLFDDQPEALQSGLEALLAREHSLLLSARESQARLGLALVKRMQALAETRT
jgi:hypothetical protein